MTAGSAGSAARTAGAGTQVLVVEDEPVIAAMVKLMLEEAGWSVIVVSPMSPELLHSAVEQLEPACVLLDGAGRGNYGQSWRDAAWLHERAHPVPVFMFSADCQAIGEARVGTSLRSRAAAFAGIIEKPFELEALEAAVAGTIDRTSDAAGVVRHLQAQDVLN